MFKRIIIVASLLLIPITTLASDAVDLGPATNGLQGTNPGDLQQGTGSTLQSPSQGLQSPATNEQIQQYMQGELSGNDKNPVPEDDSTQSLPLALLLLGLFIATFAGLYLYERLIPKSELGFPQDQHSEPDLAATEEAAKKNRPKTKSKSKKSQKKKPKTS